MYKRLLTLAPIAILLAGCAHKAPPTTQEVLEPNNPYFTRNWVADLGINNDNIESIHVREDRIFACTLQNQAFVISRVGGSLLWSTQIGERDTPILPPLLMSDRVIFPSGTHLFVYDLFGIRQPTVDLPFGMHAPSVSQNHIVFCGADYQGGGRFTAVDTDRTNGAVIWQFLTYGPVTAGPAIYENSIFVGTESNRVYAVDVTRHPIWTLEGFSFKTDGRIIANLKADDYAVYVPSTDTKLYALDRLTGHIKWSYYAEEALSASPTITPDTVYQFVESKGLVAIDKLKGKFARESKWEAPDAVQVLSLGAKRIYVRLKDGTIGALSKQTGELLWHGSKAYTRFTTNLQDSSIFVATPTHVFCYYPAGEAPSSRPSILLQPKSPTTKPTSIPASKPAAAPATPAAAPAAAPM